jgi:hypothetical protein
MVLKLGPKLARDEKLRKFKNELVSELKDSTHLRLSQDLTEAVCECIEWRIKDKYKQDKKVLVLQVIAEGHELNEEELLIVSNQIDYILNKKLVKKVGTLTRIAYKFFFMFVQKHLKL